jgi:hypothetical protein
MREEETERGYWFLFFFFFCFSPLSPLPFSLCFPHYSSISSALVEEDMEKRLKARKASAAAADAAEEDELSPLVREELLKEDKALLFDPEPGKQRRETKKREKESKR